MKIENIIGAKVQYALKFAGITTHKITIQQARPGEFHIAAIITNDAPAIEEEEAHVIKEDYRIRQIEETNQRQTQK